MDAIRKIDSERDLIAELRKAAEQIATEGRAGWGNTCLDAAQTLASKEAELVRLRAALECIAGTTASEHGTTPMMLTRCMKLARAALTQPPKEPT